MTGILFYSGSVGAGLLLGWLFVKLWRRLVPPGTHGKFWTSLGDITRHMLAVDELSLLLSLYQRLARDVGGYLLRNLSGILLACLPAGAFLIFVAPSALALWDRNSAGLVLYPPAASELAKAVDRDESLAAALGVTDSELKRQPSETVGRTAVCWSKTYCAIFRLLAFRVIETSEVIVHTQPYLVIRAQHGDVNFLWPYLNDLEFVFICAFMAATAGGLLRGRTSR